MTGKQFDKLKNKWVAKHQELTKILYDKHKDSLQWAVENLPATHKLVAGSLGGLMLMGVPAASGALQHQTIASQNLHTDSDNSALAKDLSGLVPAQVRPLSTTEEQQISGVLTQDFGFRVIPDVGGLRLDRTYGLIGAEQHLPRYPGDTVYQHTDTTSDWNLFGPSGITPGLGAWGYFAPSKDQLTNEDIQREKWYIAVQTFLAPNFSDNVAQYRDFFKYRKMLVVNPNTGQAVVTDIADAGPATFTGKHLGGSPEVMYYLGYQGGPRKGPVLFFFIDDPDNVIPLGPVHTVQS